MKAGRITVAVTLIIIGLTFLCDQWMGTNLVIQLLPWWPVALIALGVEILVFLRGKDKKLDIGGIILLIIVFGVTALFAGVQALGLEISLEDGFNVQIGDFHGETRPLEPMTIPIQHQTTVVLENVNGDITVTAYDGDELVVHPTLSLPEHQLKREDKIRQGISFDVNDTEQDIRINVEWNKNHMSFLSFFQNMHAVHLDVKVPSTLSVEVETLNGSITVKDVRNMVQAEVVNGTITIENIENDVVAEAANGPIHIENVDGSVKAETANGKIEVHDVGGSVNVESAAGSIELASPQVNGDWHATTAAGSIEVSLPNTADAQFRISTDVGKVTSDYALNGDNELRTGTIGRGKYHVQLETAVGSIQIHQLTMP